MSEKEIIRKAEKKELFPNAPELHMEFCIGREQNAFSYIAPVSTDYHGSVSGGGTTTGSYAVFS